MATFLMFGDYSQEAIGRISSERTEQAAALIGRHGGKLRGGYALLGAHDLLLIVEMPGIEETVKVSVALSKLTGIAFTTAPAVSLEAFDKLVG